MGTNQSDQTVKKTVNFTCGLAGAIAIWADGAGVGFGEAVRRLCSQGLATWPGSPFAAPAGSSQEVINEIRRSNSETVSEIRNAIENATEDIITAGRNRR